MNGRLGVRIKGITKKRGVISSCTTALNSGPRSDKHKTGSVHKGPS